MALPLPHTPCFLQDIMRPGNLMATGCLPVDFRRKEGRANQHCIVRLVGVLPPYVCTPADSSTPPRTKYAQNACFSAPHQTPNVAALFLVLPCLKLAQNAVKGFLEQGCSRKPGSLQSAMILCWRVNLRPSP